MNINYYSYQELLAALKAEQSEENIKNIVEWFDRFYPAGYNGECYDADGILIFPVYKEIAEDEFEIIGYEIR